MVRQHTSLCLPCRSAVLPRVRRSKMLMVSGMSQVQVLVHVRPADHGGKAHFELLHLETHTSVLQVKQQVARCWTM